MVKATDIESSITVETVKKYLSYDPTCGTFVWLTCEGNRKNNSRAGMVAGSVKAKSGYNYIWIEGRHYLAHRLAWLYVYGEWPSEHVDHKDGDKLNNRISNLRLASNSQNKSNGKLYKHSTSGFKGVSKVGKRWKAQIVHGYKLIYLGCHDTKEQAHNAYINKAKELQGEFARSA